MEIGVSRVMADRKELNKDSQIHHPGAPHILIEAIRVRALRHQEIIRCHLLLTTGHQVQLLLIPPPQEAIQEVGAEVHHRAGAIPEVVRELLPEAEVQDNLKLNQHGYEKNNVINGHIRDGVSTCFGSK